jgi:hypothetical protein
MNHIARSTLALTVLLAAGCGPDTGPTASNDMDPAAATSSAALVGPALDVDGPWVWSETTVLKLRPVAAAIFGIEPEGPLTHIECESWGELILTQNGAAFAGPSNQSSWCVTAGGHEFDPSGGFPASLDLVDGQLQGRALRFTFETGVFPCHYKGAVRVDGGQVTELHATGACEVPAELGNDKILNWTAVRP